MTLPITTILASLIALLLVRLSLRVIQLRRKNQVSLGDGGHEDLRRAIRGQANCAEYAPVGVLLVLIAELQSTSIVVTAILALLAAAFLLGRLLHGYALGYAEKAVGPRVRGMQLTVLSIVGLAALNLLVPAIGLLAGPGAP